MALLIRTATGFRSLACASKPRRCASSGIEPPPANGSNTGGGLPPVDFRISARACCKTFSLLEFSHFTSSSIKRNSRSRSFSWACSVGNSSGCSDGSPTSEAKSTARQAHRSGPDPHMIHFRPDDVHDECGLQGEWEDDDQRHEPYCRTPGCCATCR